MIKLKMFALVSSVLFLSSLLSAQNAAPKTTSGASAPQKTSGTAKPASTASAGGNLPTVDEVNEYLKRNFGYDPSSNWEVLDIHDSGVPGIAEIVVSVNKREPYHFYFAPHEQIAFVGQELPFGPNPFAANRAKLKGAFGPSRGQQPSAIDIVEFSDLQCPHCKAAQPIVEKLLTDFPQVHFIFQQFPLPASLHPWAYKAAEYADCAGQMNKDAFWKYVDAIFDNQGGIALATADDKLKELATTSGLDAGKISACAASPEADARVKKSLELGQSLGVNQTPVFFINGRMVLGLGSMPYDNLKALVQFEIDHAGK